MQDKHASEGSKQGKSGKQDRFQSLSWLYRDGLAYRGAPTVPQDSTVRRAKKQASQKPAVSKRSRHISSQKNNRVDERFSSMKWLYRDTVGSNNSAKHDTPQKNRDIEKASPLVSTGNTEPEKPRFKQPKEQDKYEAMRWLFEDEAEYQKAVAELKAEDAAREAKKVRAKQARKERITRLRTSVRGNTKRVAQYVTSKPKYAAAGVATMAVIGLGFGGFTLLGSDGSNTKAVAGDAVEQKTPEFDTVIPGDDTNRLKSGIAYDETRKSASFQDELDGKQIVVAQQPTPDRFAADQKVEFEKFAKEINCTTFFQAGDTYACSGLSVKGPQTVSFIKNKLLVFISAESEIPTGAWVSYIENLK